MKIDKRILINLLPGLLPLFVFIIADEIWDTQTGLMVAVAFGIVELFITYVKTGRFEKFIFLDTGFIIVLGAVSILLDNEIFFRLKPAFVELIFAAILAVSIYGPKNLVMEMSMRYVRNMSISKSAISKMNRTIKILLGLTLFHILLVLYSAFFMSKEAWAFISGVLFYLIFAGYFLFELVKNKLEKNKTANGEFLPVVNTKGEVTGRALRQDLHFQKEKLLHPVVHLHVFNGEGKLFLQKRPDFKDVQPGKWDTAVGGHIDFGETIEEGLFREAKEETGIEGFKPVPAGRYIWETEIEKELVYMFVCTWNKPINICPGEVADGKFWSIPEIKRNMNRNIFTPNFVHEFNILTNLVQEKSRIKK